MPSQSLSGGRPPRPTVRLFLGRSVCPNSSARSAAQKEAEKHEVAILEQTMKLDQAVKAAQAVAAAKASGEARAIIDAGRDALAADLDKKLGHTVTGDRCLHALRALCHSHARTPHARRMHRALGALARLGLAWHTSLCRLSPAASRGGALSFRSLVGMACSQLLRWRLA